jgi:hypothetical protein
MITTRPTYPALLTLALVGAGAALGARQVSDLDLRVTESDLEPNVTIQEHENRVVEEYRVNNRLYMIKITPSFGAPYYLVDDDGSGDMEYRRDSGGRDIRVPQWTLFSW